MEKYYTLERHTQISISTIPSWIPMQKDFFHEPDGCKIDDSEESKRPYPHIFFCIMASAASSSGVKIKKKGFNFSLVDL